MWDQDFEQLIDLEELYGGGFSIDVLPPPPLKPEVKLRNILQAPNRDLALVYFSNRDRPKAPPVAVVDIQAENKRIATWGPSAAKKLATVVHRLGYISQYDGIDLGSIGMKGKNENIVVRRLPLIDHFPGEQIAYNIKPIIKLPSKCIEPHCNNMAGKTGAPQAQRCPECVKERTRLRVKNLREKRKNAAEAE